MDENKKPNFWLRLRHWSRRHLLILISSAVILLIASATILVIMMMHKAPQPTPAPAPAPAKAVVVKPVVYYSPLTGLPVADEAATTQPVTAIMIENSPDARPQSGLKDSGVVFEAIAEGGITRFMVLYQQEKPQLIGPVRSIRLYDAEWLAAFNASIGHVGGSMGGLNEVRNGNYRDIDQFFNSSSYWRSSDGYAPHNVYTSFAKLDALNAAKGYTTSKFTGFTRTDAKPSATPNATTVNITMSSALYNSTYQYDAATNTYKRFQAGAPHLDRESGQIAPTVVIAMRVNESTVLQDGYREQIDAIGTGAATIFQNGTAQNVNWHKTSKASQITFTDATGADVPLVRGQTWIAAVPNGAGDVSWK